MFFIAFDGLPLIANCMISVPANVNHGWFEIRLSKLDFRHASLVLKRDTVLGPRFRQHASGSLKLRDNNFT